MRIAISGGVYACAFVLSMAVLPGAAQAEDPFAEGADALAVKDSDGSSSVRAKQKVTKLKPDMIKVKVKAVDSSRFPNCVFTARVLTAPTAKKKHFKLLGRGKTYRFTPVLKKRGKRLVLSHKMTRLNLGACYYPKRTKLVVRISGVDLKKKAFKASEIYAN
jgi:hypothetical protein